MSGGSIMSSWNQFLAFSPLYAVSNPAESVFWPGCSAMKLGSGLMSQTYQALRQVVPELGFSSWCCAKPTFSIGSNAQKQKREGQLDAYFAHNGIKRLYTLCPNCHLTIAMHSAVEVLSAWPLLAEYAHKRAAQSVGFAHTYILHDPCEAKRDVDSQQAVRSILNSRGVAYAEFEHCGTKTRCCGRKNMLFQTHPASSKKLLQARLDEARDLPIVTYCESCVEAFLGAGHEAVHLLEILFDKPVGRSVINRVRNARRKEFHA